MTPPTLTCEHCESEIDVAKDPRCIQDGGLSVVCAACRDAWLGRSIEEWDELFKRESPQRGCEALREAYRIKRGWQA